MTKTPAPVTVVERITAWTGSIPSLILHTIFFVGALAAGVLSIAPWDTVLLVLTTVVSLEAIYLSLLIQITVNRNTASLREVEEDLEEIQEDVEEIQEDVEELGEDMDEIQEDIEEISEDLEEIQEDVEEMTEEDKEEEERAKNEARTLEELTGDMRKILDELETLKKKK